MIGSTDPLEAVTGVVDRRLDHRTAQAKCTAAILDEPGGVPKREAGRVTCGHHPNAGQRHDEAGLATSRRSDKEECLGARLEALLTFYLRRLLRVGPHGLIVGFPLLFGSLGSSVIHLKHRTLLWRGRMPISGMPYQLVSGRRSREHIVCWDSRLA